MGCFPGLKGRRREVGHQTLSSAEVKNEWSYASTSPPAVMACAGDTVFHFYDKCIATCYIGKENG